MDMYIEKVNLEHLKQYFKKNEHVWLELVKEPDCIYAKILVDSFGPMPEFELKDFECEPLNTFAELNNEYMAKCFKEYLAKTFDDYKDAHNEYLKQKYESEMIK